jgi:type IX secretion system PorP/SprF family membrane protein
MMLRQFIIIISFILIRSTICYGQEPDAGPGFQNMLTGNPAFAGSEGTGTLRLSYLNFYPGNSFDLHSVYCSYDSYFDGLHGGAAICITDNYLGGIINDLRAGLSYSYFLKAGQDLFINGGLSASVYNRGYNFSNAVLPDQIDALGGISLPTSEVLASPNRTVFDIAAGFLVMSGNLSAGLAVDHLAEPDLSVSGSNNEKLKRKILFHASGSFSIDKSHDLKINPLTYLVIQNRFLLGGVGASLEGRSLAFNLMFIDDTGSNLNLQTGISFGTGRMRIFYNYRFNIYSGNSLLPLSVLHHTGLTFSLNSVEKRNTIRTINFPKL